MTTVALKKQTDFNQDFEFRFHGGKYQEMFLIRFQKEQTVNRKKNQDSVLPLLKWDWFNPNESFI